MRGWNNKYGRQFIRGKGYKGTCEWCGEDFFGRANKKFHYECKVAKQNSENSINNTGLKQISMKKEQVEKALNYLQKSQNKTIDAKKVVEVSGVHKFYSNSLLWKMKCEGLLERLEKGVYKITEKGVAQAILNEKPKVIPIPIDPNKDAIEKIQYCLTEFIELMGLFNGRISSGEKNRVISTWRVNGSILTHALRIGYFNRLSQGFYSTNLKEVTFEQAKALFDKRKELTYRKGTKKDNFEVKDKSTKTPKRKAMRNNEKLIGYIQKRKVKKTVNSKMASRILKITPQSANSLLAYMEKQGELVRMRFGVYTLSDKFMRMEKTVSFNETEETETTNNVGEYEYEKIMAKQSLVHDNLPLEAKIGIKQIKDIEKAINMLTKQRKVISNKTYEKIKAIDNFVCTEIVDYLERVRPTNETLKTLIPIGNKFDYFVIEGSKVVGKAKSEKEAYSIATTLAQETKKSHTVARVMKTVNVEIKITLS